MKKIILTFLILFSACGSYSQIKQLSGFSSGNNPHDSLLFDGTGEKYFSKQDDKKSCWKVKHVWGNVVGTREKIIERQIECGSAKQENPKLIYTTERGQMKDGDQIYEDDNFEMDEGSFIQIERDAPIGSDSKIIITAKCKNFEIPKCKCEISSHEDIVDYLFNRSLTNGHLFFMTYNYSCPVETNQCTIKNNGTKYSLDTRDGEDIIKVYEGSVTLSPKKLKSSAGDEIQKLSQDYQNGKISLEEFRSKSKDLSEKVLSDANKVTNGVTLESGYKMSIGDTIGEKIPIGADDDKWWENENYNK